MAAPAAVEQRRLVDDVDAAPHRGDRVRLGGREAIRGRQPVLRPDVNGPSFSAQPIEVGALMGVAALLEEDHFRIRTLVRSFPEPVDPAELERRQMAALEEPDEVRGTDDDVVPDQLHGPTLARGRATSPVTGVRPGAGPATCRAPTSSPAGRRSRSGSRRRGRARR